MDYEKLQDRLQEKLKFVRNNAPMIEVDGPINQAPSEVAIWKQLLGPEDPAQVKERFKGNFLEYVRENSSTNWSRNVLAKIGMDTYVNKLFAHFVDLMI